MHSRSALIAALQAEDRRLRLALARCPRSRRRQAGPNGTPSCQETLAHIAFWDDQVIRYFTRRSRPGQDPATTHTELEDSSARAEQSALRQPFGQAWARYLEATADLLELVERRWEAMSERQRHDLWTTVRHRRQHRLLLERLFSAWQLRPAASTAGACSEHGIAVATVNLKYGA